MPTSDSKLMPTATQKPPATHPAAEENPPVRIEVELPLLTIIRGGGALLGAYALYVLWPLLLVVFLALFLAVTLHAFVAWLDSRRMKHWLSLLLVIGGLLTVLGVGMALLVPALINQAACFGQAFPQLRAEALDQIPADWGLRQSIEHLLDPANWAAADSWLGHFMSAGGVAINGISQIALVLVIALYLLIDGGKTYEWLLAFFSPLHRRKLRLTAQEISQVIFGYVAGQIITSVLVMIYTFVMLSVLHVPGALMLAILAGVLDILPILGFIIATVPAVLLALTVSFQTAVIVVILCLLYHALENYLIVPKIYGKNLRLSTLTVLLGLLTGALLAGIPGTLAALPVIASYAAIERIWLKPFLRDGVSEKHDLQKDEAFGEQD
ncbi:MAG: AI-2E family transporter [Verrucomicrobia bacterium]|nr:AI-2E family transporter [Verrucomicrobiota bacterium]